MKIKRIQIKNYRAFLVNNDQESARYTINLPNGENLLIYGENGSGKSSLFRALKDFFNSALNTDLAFQKNLFYNSDDNKEQPCINITLEDESECSFSAETARTNTHTIPVIAKASIVKGFVGYRDLLQLHFRQHNSQPDLFSFFLGQTGLFTDMVVTSPLQPANRISYKDLWEKVQKNKAQNDISDYNTNVYAQFLELEGRANMLLKYFQKECNLKIEYNEMELQGENLVPPSISLKIKLFDRELPEHEEVLNEARLTALAISVYLAYVLSLPDTDLKILFLDDIFIGLDMSNRIPLIKILTNTDLGDGTSFQNFQIFLTTYDREWFNLAKNYLNENWSKAEFYVDSHTCTIERPLIRKSGSYKERAEFHFVNGDYPACANYLRKALEKELRRILPENTLYTGFNSTSGDNSIIALSKRNLIISENDNAWFYKFKEDKDDDVETFRFITLQQMINQFKSLVNQYGIPFAFVEELAGIKNRLLNPLSHDDLKSSIFKAELIAGFELLNELQKIVSKVILSVNNTDAIQMYSLKNDYKNDNYYYRFELRSNLRYIQYDTYRILLNATFHSQYRTRGYNFSKFEILENQYPSLEKLCKAIFHASVEPDTSYTFYENFMFDEVFTAEGEKISELI